jgi:hypothetical protein
MAGGQDRHRQPAVKQLLCGGRSTIVPAHGRTLAVPINDEVEKALSRRLLDDLSAAIGR